MILIHYGSDYFDSGKFNEVFNRIGFCKPRGGLWASPCVTEFGWEDFCIARNYMIHKLSSRFAFRLKRGTRVYRINSYNDLLKLPLLDTYPDFERLKQNYDVIWLTYKGLEETDHYTYLINLYGWDCESLLILNKNCIKILL
jgi:hypothetical protein